MTPTCNHESKIELEKTSLADIIMKPFGGDIISSSICSHEAFDYHGRLAISMSTEGQETREDLRESLLFLQPTIRINRMRQINKHKGEKTERKRKDVR